MIMTEHRLILAHRPSGPSCIRDLAIPIVGHFPKRAAPGTDRRFDYQALVIIVGGHGSFRADAGPQQAVGPGSMWFLRPGVHYRYAPPPGGAWEEYFIDLAGPGLARWSGYGLLPSRPEVHRIRDVARAIDRLRALMTLMHRGGPGAADRAVLQVEDLLLDLRLDREAPAAPAVAEPSLHALLGRLQRDYRSVIDWERLAATHAMSYITLRRGVKRLTGRSPARYLAMLRCEAARRLLLETGLAIGEVGRSVGLADPVLFCRTFHRSFGVGPAAFRRTGGDPHA